MGAGQSSSPSTSICDFSKEQILKLDKEIKKIDELILSTKRNTSYDTAVSNAGSLIPDLGGAGFANYMATLTGRPFEDKYDKFMLLQKYDEKRFSLILQHLLYAQVNYISEEYKTILKLILDLCNKYKSTYIEDAAATVEHDINEFILKKFSEANTYFNLFNQIKIPLVSDELRETIDIINEINERFLNISEIKSEMKALCAAEQKNKEATRLFGRAGGTSGKKRKRKQIPVKMKMNKPLSKTRNSKKKYNGKSVKNKRE